MDPAALLLIAHYVLLARHLPCGFGPFDGALGAFLPRLGLADLDSYLDFRLDLHTSPANLSSLRDHVAIP